MALRNSDARYGGVAIALHWLVAALVVTQFVLASLAEAAEESGSLMGQIMWLARHKSVGITILCVAAVRIAWRLANPVPAYPAGMPGWQRVAASGAHWALYGLLFALPLTGWAMSSAANFPVSVFGLFTLPDFVAADDGLKQLLADVHEVLAEALFVLALVHILAALKHQFIDRDGTLARMFGAGGTR